MRDGHGVRVLRYPIDVWVVLLSLAVLGCQVTAWWAIHDVRRLLLCVGLYLPLQSMTIPVAHNHHHLKTFLQRQLNWALEFVLFWQCGLPSDGWELNHNLGHHKNYRNQDVSSSDRDEYYWREADGRPTGRVVYTLRTAALSHYYAYRNGRRGNEAILRKYLFVMGVHVAVFAALVAARPLNTAMVFLAPMLLMMLANSWTSYAHHVGLAGDDHYSSSHTNLRRWTNVFTLNTGFHAAHHIKPTVHWSKLPEFHATIASRIPEHCYRKGSLPAAEAGDGASVR